MHCQNLIGTFRSHIPVAKSIATIRTFTYTARNTTQQHQAQLQLPASQPPHYHLPVTSAKAEDLRHPRSISPSPPQLLPYPHGARPKISAFDALQDSIVTILQTHSSTPLPKLRTLLGNYISDPTHWSAFAHADPSKQYTRNLICEIRGIFNLLLLVWTPGKASPVHDHAKAHCLMKVLSGELRERRYSIPSLPGLEGPLIQTSNQRFSQNKVSYMSDELGLHEISNPSHTDYAVSLHLYFPPNAAVRGCRIYDINHGAAKHVTQGPYDSIRGVP